MVNNMTLQEAVGIVESSGNYYAARFEMALYAAPPPWVEEGLAVALRANPDIVGSVAMRLLCTSWGKYQIMGANLYSSVCGYRGSLGRFILDTQLQDTLGRAAIFRIGKLPADSLMSDLSDAELMMFAGYWNGPAQVRNYMTALRKVQADGN